ncbi:expressed unknown protein [Seminavis robusta]|uniref:Smr domain-containing protein n=1 Tax=Seminavis robusta TaxID=568900 RepID=A0A9N8DZM6_9STRA|nr:expressed unknown protein [Seminavis robusta]|eukprot:Sro392_g133440.1 n/a (684) ;mRNA; r:47619-49670
MATLPSSGALPNNSLTWKKNGRSENQIKPFATIDLHGYTKETAIRAVTNFFETSARQAKQRNPWVMVITGTGAHSGSLGGPILKQAVQKLLIKRKMEFCYSKKKGFFYVNCLSGHVLKSNPTARELNVAAGGGAGAAVLEEPIGQDTKVKLMQRPESIVLAPPPVLRPLHKKKVIGKKIRKDLQTFAAAQQSTRPTPQQRISNSPLLSEIAADSQMIEKAKSVSLEDSRRYRSQVDKEKHQTQQILKKSQMELEEEAKREAAELEQAMALSQLEPTTAAKTQEEEVERIMMLSLQEAEARVQSPPDYNDEDDDELQRVLSQSKLEEQLNSEEEELQRILQLSMHETTVVDNNTEQEEEEALQRVLRLSMVEATVGMQLETNHHLWEDESAEFADDGLDQCMPSASSLDPHSGADVVTIQQTEPIDTESANNSSGLPAVGDIVPESGQNAQDGKEEEEEVPLPSQITFQMKGPSLKSNDLADDEDHVFLSPAPFAYGDGGAALLHAEQTEPTTHQDPLAPVSIVRPNDERHNSNNGGTAHLKLPGSWPGSAPVTSSHPPFGQSGESLPHELAPTQFQLPQGPDQSPLQLFVPSVGQVRPVSLPQTSPMASEQLPLHPTRSAGEALLESILYNNPPPFPTSTVSVERQVAPMPPPPQEKQQEPVLTQSVLEKILQQPILPPPAQL